MSYKETLMSFEACLGVLKVQLQYQQ